MCSKSDDRQCWTEMRLTSNRLLGTTYNFCDYSRRTGHQAGTRHAGKKSCVYLLIISQKNENKLAFCQLCVYLLVKKQ